MSVNKLRLEYYLSNSDRDMAQWEKIEPVKDKHYRFQYCNLINDRQLNEYYYNFGNKKWLIIVKYIKKGGKRH